MDPKLFKEFFSKGFDDELENLAQKQALEKQAKKDDSFTSTLQGDISDAVSKAVANAIVRGAVHIGGTAAKGAYRAAVGDKLRGRHKEFIAKLMATDPILKGRPKDRVISHYKTMVKVAPSISLDTNVVASFLRESTAYGTINTVTIKTLLDLEKTMTETASNSAKRYTHLIGGR